MAQRKVLERQNTLTAIASMGIADIGVGNEVTFSLPPGALLLDVTLDTVVAFDGTTNTGNVTDGTTVFISVEDLKTVGREANDSKSKFYPSGGTLTVALAQTGAATVGQVIVTATYVGLYRGGEIQA